MGRTVRTMLMTVALACAVGGPAQAAFDLEAVSERARVLASRPFDPAAGALPPEMPAMNYDQWRDIRFRPDRALWRDRGLPFQVQFFHPGLFYQHVVAINVVEGGTVRPLPFSRDDFDYGKNTFARRIPRDLGYAGFRVHYPINRPDYHDEVIVFLGASYFRAVARGEVYGLSARGIAVDTVLPRPEEFPAFREFWLETPVAGATELVLYALLDGPSVTGAYRFVVRPGAETAVEVQSRLFLRRVVERLGIAPLTSMFFFGENTTRRFDDFHPEVHDSDGLLLSFDTGEWLWRPLDNPTGVHVSALAMRDPRGFGLMQRDRDFDHYQDLEARLDLRPSVWIAPRGKWGAGQVQLVEIPTADDAHDNVVAFWVPDGRPGPGNPLSFDYVMSWGGVDAARPPGGRVIATRRDTGTKQGGARFVVDFGGPNLVAIPGDQEVRGIVTIVGGAAAGDLIDQHVVKNPVTGGWRLSFQLRPTNREPLELRAYLARGSDVLTETWSYVVRP